MNVRELGHLVLYVRDVARSAAFYRDVLGAVQAAGATVVGASDHTVAHSLYILDPDGNEIELYGDVPGADWRSDPSLIGAPIRPLAL